MDASIVNALPAIHRWSRTIKIRTTAAILSIAILGGVPISHGFEATSLPSPAAKPAIDGVLDLFQKAPVVVLCDYHGLAQEEAFYSALVRDPRFAAEVGNVIVEFGEISQPIIDRYVDGETVPLAQLRRVWTETPGLSPGPFWVGYENFFASIRAANSKLPPDRRIKVWLGDPKADWSKINSYQDLLPFLLRRDDNYVRIIGDEILDKHRKALLIIGSAHIFGAGLLSAKLSEAHPDSFATVMPFVGYLEPRCNEQFLNRAKSWQAPALVGPIADTWLKAELQLSGCDFIPPAQVQALLSHPPPKTLPPGFVGAITSPHQLINVVSGEDADAILYLGAPDSLTGSPIDPDIYLDPDYFREEDRRSRCCTRAPGRGPLDWQRLVEEGSVIPRKLVRF
jgi:hypothetical protein